MFFFYFWQKSVERSHFYIFEKAVNVTNVVIVMILKLLTELRIVQFGLVLILACDY